MQVSDGYIQYYNGREWENLIAVDELRGAQGAAGQDGRDGQDGADGTDGQNGKNGADGINGRDGADGQNACHCLGLGQFCAYDKQNDHAPLS